MNLQQQAQNVAKAGRYGDSMLLHVNPIEMKGLRQSLPITRNPKTGQDEAFLPFLAPLAGSLLGSSLLAGVGGMSALTAGALGSGLAQYAVTGDLKKGIMAGLTGYGIGKIAQGASAATQGAQAADAATQSAISDATVANLGVDSAAVTGLNPAGGFTVDTAAAMANPSVAAQVGSQTTQAGIEAARTGATQMGLQTAKDATIGANLKTAFTNPQGGFAPMQGASSVASAAMQPGAYIPAAIGMGGTGIMESQEAFQEMLAKNAAENEERKKRMQEEYEATQKANLPLIGGTPANFYTGGFTGFDMPVLDFDGGGYGNFGNFGGYYDPIEPPFIPPINLPPSTPTPPQTGFPGAPNVPGEFFTPGINPEFGYLSGQVSPSFTNQTYNQFTSPFDMAYQGFYAPQFNPSYNINPYSSFDPFMASMPFMSIPQNNPPVPPIQPPILPPPDDGINPPPPPPPIDPPIQVPPPVTQPGGPGVIDPGKQPPPITSIGYDPLSDPRIYDLINQKIDRRVEDLGVPSEGFPQYAPRTDQDIQALIDQSISGIPRPAFNENELVDRLRNQFVSYDRLPDVIPEPIVGGSAFDPSDIYGQLGELRGQFSSLPQEGGRTDAELQAIINDQLEGFQPVGTPPRSDQDIQALIDQRLSGLPTFGDDFTSINQRLDELYNRPQFTPYDPTGLQEQFGSLQNQFGQLQGQFQGMPNFDDFARTSDIVPPNFDDRFMSIDQQLSDLRNAPGFDPSSLNLPDFNQFALRSDIQQFDPSGLQQQISGLQDQFAGFQPFNPSGLQQDIGQLQGQFAGLPDFGQFATQSQIPTMPDLSQFALQSQLFDPSGLQQQLGGLAEQQAGFAQNLGNLEGQLGSLPDFSQFATQSQLPTMPDMSQYALQSQLFNPSGIQNQLAGLQGQFNTLPDFSQFAMQSQIPQMPNMNQYALASQIPQMPDMSQYALASQIPQMPNMSNFVTQQGLSNALNPYALQSQMPMMPDMNQFALASQIPNVSNFVTSSQLANSLSPYAFRTEIPQFPTGGNFSVSQPPVQQFSPVYTGYQEGKKTEATPEPVQVTEAVISDPITIDLVSFIQGETQDKTIVDTFIEKYGNEMFMAVRQMILQQINPGAQTEGQVEGVGNGGMDDDIPMSIGADTTAAAVSQDEYIIPADVLSQAGDGSSDAGAAKFDNLLNNIRQEKYGKKEQPQPLQKDLRSYMT